MNRKAKSAMQATLAIVGMTLVVIYGQTVNAYPHQPTLAEVRQVCAEREQELLEQQPNNPMWKIVNADMCVAIVIQAWDAHGVTIR